MTNVVPRSSLQRKKVAVGTPELPSKQELLRRSNRGGATPGCATGAREAGQRPTPSSRTAGQPCTPTTRAAARKETPSAGYDDKNRTSNAVGKQKSTLSARRCNSKPKELTEVCEEGETYKVGDDVFYIIDPEKYDDMMLEEEEEDDDLMCAHCNRGKRKRTDFLECDYCWRAFHRSCVKVKPVDGENWECQKCERGEPYPESISCLSEAFVRTTGAVGLGRIMRLLQHRGDQVKVEVEEYQRPDQDGLQKPIARQVHATSELIEFPAEHLICHVTVANDRIAMDAADTDNVFLCETRYNVEHGRYERILHRSEDESESEEYDGSQPGSSSSDDDGDADGDSEDESEEEAEPPAPAQPKKRPRKAAPAQVKRKRMRQGGEAWVQRHQEAEVLGTFEHAAKADESPACAAQRLLTLAERPVCLPCRDTEKQTIRGFIEDAISAQPNMVEAVEDAARCLYIAGVPGTGKTACVTEVVQSLQQCPHVPAFRFVYINALYLPTPAQFYAKLFEAIRGHRVGAPAARVGLEEFFGSQKSSARTTVLVVDEIDMLLTRDQNVLYNLFSWPLQPTSRLAVIGIANTLDLPHRLLPKIRSRMGSLCLSFGPYSKQQMIDIVKDRLRDLPGVIDDRAVDLVARRVATVSGDIRRTLALLRHAVVLWSTAEKPEKSVTMAVASQACKAVFDATHMRAMEQLSPLEQVLIASLILESRFTGTVSCELAAVASRTMTLLRMQATPNTWAKGSSGVGAWHPDEILPAGTLFMAVKRLDASRLILLTRRYDLWAQRLTLNVPVDDAIHVLMGSDKIPWVRSILGVVDSDK